MDVHAFRSLESKPMPEFTAEWGLPTLTFHKTRVCPTRTSTSSFTLSVSATQRSQSQSLTFANLPNLCFYIVCARTRIRGRMLCCEVERLKFFGCPTFDDAAARLLADWLMHLQEGVVPSEVHLSDCAITTTGFLARWRRGAE